jgi:rhamnogalacturonan acetylesterase
LTIHELRKLNLSVTRKRIAGMMRRILRETGAFCQSFCITKFAFSIQKFSGGQTNFMDLGSVALFKFLSSLIVTSFIVLASSLPSAAQSQGPRPGRPLPEPANQKLPSLYLIGDSTVRNGDGNGSNGQWGWGDHLAVYFDPKKINVVNRALGGLSSRTYLTFDYWDRLMALLKPGDVVIMQFGHNDAGPINDNVRARGSIKGTSEETEEIDNILTGKHEVVHSYGWYLRKFIADAQARGATPIVCSPVPRKAWREGKINSNSEDYGKWSAQVAESARVRFIPLNAIIARKYEELGPEKVEPLFFGDNTHTSLAGAELNAASVIAGLKALKNNPLSRYFSDKAKSVGKWKPGSEK